MPLEALVKATAKTAQSCARLGVRARDRDDFAQEVFLAAARSYRRYDPTRGSVEAWLNGVIVHLANRYHKMLARGASPCDADVVDESPGAEEALLQGPEERAAILRALEMVEPRVRFVVTAHDLQGAAMVDVAAELGIPTSTAYKWLYRGRHAFRAAFLRRGRGLRAPGRE